MRTGRIARAGQARSFRRRWFYWIEVGEQRFAAGLPRYSHKRDKVIGRRGCGAAFDSAAVAVSVENAPMVIHGDFVEVEQIAILMAAALLPNACVTLNGIV